MEPILVNSRLRLRRSTVVHVRRCLPLGKGKLKVILGQEVIPSDVLGEGQIPAGFHTISLAKDLGVGAKEAMGFLKRGLGQTIYQDELLASRVGLFGLGRRNLLSPVDGVIDLYDPVKGSLRIKLISKKTTLVSGVYGVVDRINVNSGTVIIRTLANTIFGVAGLGKEREGILAVLGKDDALVGSKQLSSSFAGKIVIGGGFIFGDALEKAIDLRLAGLVTGGLNFRDFKAVGGRLVTDNKHWSDVGLSLMVTGGFGSVPLGSDIFPVIQGHTGKFCFLDGNKSRLVLPSDQPDSMIYIRKTKLPTVGTVEFLPEVEAVELGVGMKVRIINSPLMGVCGVVEAIDQTPTKLPSGITTTLVTVVTSRQKARLPCLNIELLR